MPSGRARSEARVVVSGAFDDLRYGGVRFLQEAARSGSLQVLLWSDEVVRAATGRAPRFPFEERRYFVEALRWVAGVTPVAELASVEALPEVDGLRPLAWSVFESDDSSAKRAFCEARGIDYSVVRRATVSDDPLEGEALAADAARQSRKVIVSGCYDWLHTGHVRFFEEASAYGDLCVAVGHDANIRLLKGAKHPMFPQHIRRYMVGAVRHVWRAVVTTGHGWMDAAPEIAAIRPDRYLVNEDGDNVEKRQFCQQHGLEYVVLKRAPRAGLPARSSTNLRSF